MMINERNRGLRKNGFLKRLVSWGLVLCLCFSICTFALAESDGSSSQGTSDEVQMTDKQRNSINMLNYLTVLVQEINKSSNSRLFLESAYSELINNTEPSIVDDLTLDEYEKILGIIEGYRMVAVKRERLQYIYEQNSAAAIRSAMPNPLSLLNVVQSGNPLKALVSVAYMAFDSVNSYKSYTDQLELQYLQDGWALDDEEAARLADSRSSMFSYMVRVARDLPRGLTLNEDSVADFVKWKNEPNVTSRIRWLESNRSTYANYGEYWLVLADSYYEKAQSSGETYYTKCLEAIAAYERLDNSIFRKDFRFAQSLPYAIIAAQETLEGQEYISTAARFAKLILDNTNNSDWSLRYFAAQTFIELYAKTKTLTYLQTAYDVAYDNVNELVAEQRKQNSSFLADLQLASTKGLKGDEKKELENYNKLLKEARKTELAPIYEPLRLNCDLLFALAEELNISSSAQSDIDRIIHPNGEALFLNPVVDALYTFSSSAKMISLNEIDIVFDKDEITIPAMYLTATSSITVTITEGTSVQTISDWTLESVDRHKSKDVGAFTAKFTSAQAKKATYNDGATIVITIVPITDKDHPEVIPVEPLVFKFKAVVKTYAWVIHPLSFSRVYE